MYDIGKKKKQHSKLTFSKKLVAIILTISMIDLQIPFILAFLGREQIAESLAIAVVTEILGTIVTYSIKAYSETREEERNKLRRELELDKEAEG